MRTRACIAAAMLFAATLMTARAAEWSYEGPNGPARWGRLKAAYAACAQGRMQSPIDLRTPALRADAGIVFDYKPAAFELRNNGHTIEALYPPGSGLTVEGRRFELVQFHFHAPSEHALRGRRYPMDIHLVHRSADGRLAVVGIFMEYGRANPVLAALWRRMPSRAGASEKIGSTAVSAASLLPEKLSFWRYEGSLTTPPCSEGVRWFVAEQTIPVGKSQVERFVRVIGRNARPLQPLHGRKPVGPLQP